MQLVELISLISFVIQSQMGQNKSPRRVEEHI